MTPAVTSALSTGAMVGVVLAALNLPAATLTAPVLDPAADLVSWDLPVVRNEYVQRFVNLLQVRQPDRMAAYLRQSGRYEGMILSKLRERGLPEDLLYLSMIESGFNPSARSQAAAVGLWQFIPETGRRYGLRIDEHVDERMHPEESTDAAIRYLLKLHEQFGSWNLAAAAYNSGENRVARIMREETGRERGDEADFWRIRHRLPNETREYVPLMLAAALIGKEPARYGMEGVERLLPVAVERVLVPGGTDIDRIATAIRVRPDIVRELNPHLIAGTTPPGDAYPVRVPAGKSLIFTLNFRSAGVPTSVSAAPETQAVHTVATGESLWTVARKHGLTVRALQLENGMGRNTAIKPGQELRLPS